MLRRLITISLSVVVFIICVGAGIWFVLNNEAVQTTPGTGERIIADELSLWQNPVNSGISYAQFEPLRVRDQGAMYFPRTSKSFAASGSRYGQIQLNQDDGGLLYLPREISYDATDAVHVSVRTDNAQAKWQITLYPDVKTVAHINADTPGIEIVKKEGWQEITIPLSSLAFEPYKLTYTDGDWRDPNYLLAQYTPRKHTFYGIGFSLKGGKKGDSLYIDRLSLIKKVQTKTDTITGQLIPPVSGAHILLRSDAGERTAPVKWNGAFEIEIPQGAKMIEVVAQTASKIITPRQGRFFEIGTYLPKIMIDTWDAGVHARTYKGNSNESFYIYDEKYGPRLEPNQSFLVQVKERGQMQASAELATNALGYIDRDRRINNPDNAYRALVLGECHHMGVHLAQADDWWNEAEAVTTMLAKRPVEVISASFNHASWTSAWPAFRDLSKDLSPDIVLLPMIDPGVLNLSVEEYMMDWLGAAQDHRPAYQFEFGPDGKIVHKPNDPDWQLYREIMPEEQHARIREQYVSLPYVYADAAQEPEWVKANIKLTIATLAEFAKLAKERKTRVGILYISNYGSSKTDMVVENGITYDPNKFRTLMKDMAEQSGVEFIDISDDLHMSMGGHDSKRMFYASNGHFTPYAHYRYGQVLGNLFSSWVNDNAQPKKEKP